MRLQATLGRSFHDCFRVLHIHKLAVPLKHKSLLVLLFRAQLPLLVIFYLYEARVGRQPSELQMVEILLGMQMLGKLPDLAVVQSDRLQNFHEFEVLLQAQD